MLTRDYIYFLDKDKQFVNNMCESSKNVSSKKSGSNNSFCREIMFHGKEILSYCTTSSIHLNEKDNQTVSCLSIKDIVSIYFPWSSIEQFIQICRKKQITRFKPDKSTDYDSTLRLVNIQELENHWSFILKELLPNIQTSIQKHSDQSEINKLSVQSSDNNLLIKLNSNDISLSNVNTSHTTKTLELPSKESSTESSSIEIDISIPNNNETSFTLNTSDIELNGQINKSYQLELDLLKTNQEEPFSSIIIQKKCSLKKKRRRRGSSYTLRRKRKEQFTSRSKILKQRSHSVQQFWMKKYSIEPFSILIDRYELPQN